MILWDLTDPNRPRRLGSPLTVAGRASSVAFTLDGRTLATASFDGTATLWNLTDLYHVRDHTVERACSATCGGLDRDGWAHYIPDLPYRESRPA